MFHALLAAAAVLVAADIARADEAKLDASFVGDGTYSPTTGCKKLEDIQNGKATPNISTYPLTLTREGTGSWKAAAISSRSAKSSQMCSKARCSAPKERTNTLKRSRSVGSIPTASKLRAERSLSFMSAAKG